MKAQDWSAQCTSQKKIQGAYTENDLIYTFFFFLFSYVQVRTPMYPFLILAPLCAVTLMYADHSAKLQINFFFPRVRSSKEREMSQACVVAHNGIPRSVIIDSHGEPR